MSDVRGMPSDRSHRVASTRLMMGAGLLVAAMTRPLLTFITANSSPGAITFYRSAGMLSSSEPAWSPAGDRVAFSVAGEDQSGIYTMSPDGRDVRRLTGDPNDYENPGSSPRWSPDGRELLYARPDGIWVMRDGGTGIHRLLRGDPHVAASSPVWSPDGTQIAYILGAMGKGKQDTPSDEIWIMDSTGRNARRLALIGSANHLAWSPDGRTIAFEARHRDSVAVHLLDVTTKGDRRITSGAHWDGAPSWSKDGRQLAIIRAPRTTVKVRNYLDEPDYHGRLVILKADGSGESLQPNVFDAFTGSAPTWSPDGRQVIYVCGPPAFGPHGPNAVHLCIVDMPNGRPRRVSWSIRTTRFPAWSPDGRRIAYVLREDGDSSGSELRVASVDGSSDTVVVPRLDVVSPPTWSPDGRRLAFVAASRSPRYASLTYSEALFVLDSLKSTPRMIPVQTTFADRIFGLALDAPAVWAPDGHRIAIEAERNPQMLDFRRSVFVVNVDDSAQVEPAPELDLQLRPAWSPNGRSLAVTATAHVDSTALHIYVLDASGGAKPRMLSDRPELIDALAAWTSDGKTVAYLSGPRDTTDSRWQHLVVRLMPVEGGRSQERASLPVPRGPEIPVWAPDARSIAFVVVDSDHASSRIEAVDAVSGNGRWLTSDVRHAYDPAWSPDGRWLAFVSDRDGVAAVYVADAAGHFERQVAPPRARLSAVPIHCSDRTQIVRQRSGPCIRDPRTAPTTAPGIAPTA